MGRFDTISTSDDYLDSRQIEERIDDLESVRELYTIVVNMPGYMPDSEPNRVSDWDSACAALAEEMRRTIEGLDETGDAELIALLTEEADRLADDYYSEGKKEGAGEWGQTFGSYHYSIVATENEGLDADDFEELTTWRALKSDCEGYGWDDGIQLIREDKFTEYAQEFADDIGAIDRNAAWPLNHIDWEAAARELKQDYSETEIDGKTYYYREA